MRKTSFICRSVFLYLCLTLPLFLKAQIAPGQWQMHLAYHDAVKSIKAFSKVFVLSDGALYSYDGNDNSIQTYDKANFLSDNDIADIDYCQSAGKIVIAYRNGNIDLLSPDDDVYNITDILTSSLRNKEINQIFVSGNKAYISSEGGIIILDITKCEISDAYTFAEKVKSTVLYHNLIIANTETGVYKGNIADNLKDSSKWICLDKRDIFTDLTIFKDRVVITAFDHNIFYFDVNNGKIDKIDTNVINVNVSSGYMYVYKNNVICVHNPDNGNITEYSTTIPVRHILKDGNTLWISSSELGLNKCSLKDKAAVISVSNIIPDSPVRNLFDFMKFDSQGKLLVAGGSLNYFGIYNEGTLMTYQNNKWFNFPEDGISDKTGLEYINLTSLAEDESTEGHYFAGSARQGLYEYRDNRFYKLHTFDNSGLATILPDINPYNYVSVDGVQYDSKGNLWMLNNEVDTILKIMHKDGSWSGLFYPELKGLPTFKHILLENDGEYIWTASTRAAPGIFCSYTNGTIFNDKDDVHRFSGDSFKNQDNITVTVNDIFFFEKDLNGIMWIGTDQGIFTLNDPSSFINDDNLIFNRVKIPRNDGSGLADYLLSNVYTSAICIDSGNRKWIGTKGNGIYFLDESGTETLLHFTVENSPLLSNNIINIKIDSESGNVFIATDKGLCIYGSDSFASRETLDKSDITVFPNPVMPETDGIVHVKGLSYNCTVKILNSAGRIVYEDKSNGGGFTWNCGNGSRRVPSGIYYIMAIDQNGRKSVVKTVTIIK